MQIGIVGAGFAGLSSQDIPFLPADVVERLTDENGDDRLHRQNHPIDVPELSVAGSTPALATRPSGQPAPRTHRQEVRA